MGDCPPSTVHNNVGSFVPILVLTFLGAIGLSFVKLSWLERYADIIITGVVIGCIGLMIMFLGAYLGVLMPAQANNLISHKTLADQVFDYLSQAVLSGELRTGDHLVESDLSDKLGISRAPVREALAELKRQGLAYSLVRRGTFVRPWTKEDLWEVAILRATLEALAAQLAVPHITEDDLTFLEHTIEEMGDAEHADDSNRLIDLDFAFHDRVVDACRHRRLQEMLHDMRLQIRIFRIVTRRTDYATYPEMHRKLLEALRTGDPHTAQQTVYAHVMESAELALAALPDDGVLSMPATSK